MKHTNWTTATTNPYMAIMGLISCMQYYPNCWIEYQKNGDQAYPIQCPNPLLDDPFNWEMSYSVPAVDDVNIQEHFLNETEKDLYENWTCCFGTEEAVLAYKERGEVTKGLFSGSGVSCPVRMKDATAYRANIDGYQYGYWRTHWKPKQGIPYRIADPDVGNVFVVCYDDEPVESGDSTVRAAQTLLDVAGTLLDIAGVDQAAGHDKKADNTANAKRKIALVLDNGVVTSVDTNVSGLNVTVYDMDHDMVPMEEREAIYERIENDPTMKPCKYRILPL